MKTTRRLFSLMIVIALLFQTVTMVFAANDSVTVPTSVHLRVHNPSVTDGTGYTKGTLTKTGSETFDFKAVIGMGEVWRTFKDWYTKSENVVKLLLPTAVDDLQNTPITGEFAITAKFPETMSIPTPESLTTHVDFDGTNIDANMAGFNDEAKKHFVVTSRNITKTGSEYTFVVTIKPWNTATNSELKIKDLKDEFEAIDAGTGAERGWFDLEFEVRDVSVAGSRGSGAQTLKLSATGSTDSEFGIASYKDKLHVAYRFLDSENLTDLTATVIDASITFPPSGGGGGTTRYTITFNVDGDTKTVAPITRARNTTIKLSELSIPHKDGYTFDGWYSDAEKTKKITEEFKLTGNMTVYGSWKQNDINKGHSRLNTTDHFAYVVGYPDGNVRPNQNITREEIGVIFFRLMKDDYRSTILRKSNSFTDVDASRWSNTGISTMANGKYIVGYEDGSFGPGRNITRAEFAAIAARFDDETPDSATHTFTDISGHWAEDYIARAVQRGWIAGYEDGTFRPDQNITRAEAMTIINRMLNRFVNAQGIHADAVLWPDNPKDAWFYYAVEEATNSHDYTRQSDGVNETWTKINPNRDWTEFE